MNAPDLASQQIAKAYDDRPYNSNAFFYAAPGHLRAAAHLYGISTVPLAKARVLELGCSAGGNLLPFALAYPEAQVVGIDLSVVEVEAGRQVAAAVGAKNLDLRAMSLTDITPEFGQFDYIIAVQMKCLATWGDVIHSKRKKPPTRDGVGGVSASRQFLHSRLAWGPFARRPCLARAYCTN